MNNILKCELGDSIVLNTHSDHIGRILQSGHFYEQAMLSFIQSLGFFDVIIDVGANIGNHSVFFASYCARKVVAIEPAIENFELLRLNKIQNNLNNLLTYNVGIGIENTRASYRLLPDNMGMIDLSKGSGSVNIVKPNYVIDEPFDLIKIDCESMSIEVFEAFLPMLIEFKPHIFIEGNFNDVSLLADRAGCKVGNKFNATDTYRLFW